MISKEKLVFDIADPAQGDNVGAYLRSADGTLITHETVSGDEGLHVFLLNASIAVTATDLDIRDLSAAQDSVAISDGTDTLAVNADGSINAVVSATDLDIRDLTQADEITVYQGTSPWVIGDGGGSITVDGSVTVSATDLDIRDLTAASDSVAAWLSDGAGNAITSSGGALDINIASSDIEIDVENDVANVAIENTAASVTSTSAALLGSQLADRRFMYVQNLGNRAIFVGKSGVTTADGLRLSSGSVAEFRLGPAVSMHAVTDSGTQDTRVMELS